jgi:hypothetical protein
MAVVVFDPVLFKQGYPEFAGMADAVLMQYFAQAEQFVDNTDGSRVVNETERLILLSLLVAHIARLRQNAAANGGGLVGRVSSATEGSVSVSADYGQIAYGQAWYVQTQYGAEYWSMTAKYRTFRYRR